MAIQPTSSSPRGFCTHQVWVQVEILTHRFADTGPVELWVGCGFYILTMDTHWGQKSCDLFKYSARSNLFIYAIGQQPCSVVSLTKLTK
jgi:hypothetical protein